MTKVCLIGNAVQNISAIRYKFVATAEYTRARVAAKHKNKFIIGAPTLISDTVSASSLNATLFHVMSGTTTLDAVVLFDNVGRNNWTTGDSTPVTFIGDLQKRQPTLFTESLNFVSEFAPNAGPKNVVADNVAIDPIPNLTGDNVQTAIETLQQEIDALTAGQNTWAASNW